MRRSTDIRPGHRFRSADLTAIGRSSRTEWVVDRIWRCPSGIRHARLFQAEDPGRIKSLSIAALSDATLYVSAAAAPE